MPVNFKCSIDTPKWTETEVHFCMFVVWRVCVVTRAIMCMLCFLYCTPKVHRTVPLFFIVRGNGDSDHIRCSSLAVFFSKGWDYRKAPHVVQLPHLGNISKLSLPPSSIAPRDCSSLYEDRDRPHAVKLCKYFHKAELCIISSPGPFGKNLKLP